MLAKKYGIDKSKIEIEKYTAFLNTRLLVNFQPSAADFVHSSQKRFGKFRFRLFWEGDRKTINGKKAKTNHLQKIDFDFRSRFFSLRPILSMATDGAQHLGFFN